MKKLGLKRQGPKKLGLGLRKLGLKKLGWTTVCFTYLLMVWGNLVSATGSGLACPDWPLCHGTVFPPWSFPVILEWGHRLLAFTTTGLIVFTILQVFRSQEVDPPVKRSGRFVLLLLALQILLGGLTVLLGLSALVSTTHLLIAIFVWSGLIALACTMTWNPPLVKTPSPQIKNLASIGLITLLIQLALGAVVRHGHAGLACPNFPGCLDGFWPIPLTLETLLAFTHRWWGVALIGLFLYLALQTVKQSPALARVSRRTFALIVVQVILGIGTVLTGLNPHKRATHAALGYLIWGMLFYLTFRSGGMRWLWETKK